MPLVPAEIADFAAPEIYLSLHVAKPERDESGSGSLIINKTCPNLPKLCFFELATQIPLTIHPSRDPMNADAQDRKKRFATARFAIEPSFSSFDRQRRMFLFLTLECVAHNPRTQEMPGRMARKRPPTRYAGLGWLGTAFVVVIAIVISFKRGIIATDFPKTFSLPSFQKHSPLFVDASRPAGENLACDGASIIDAWTSPPIVVNSQIIPPSDLLKEDSRHPWCFAGDSGRVGIALRSPGILSYITVNVTHSPQRLHRLWGLILGTITTAPREVIAWGFVDGETVKKQIARLRGIPPPTTLANAGMNNRYQFVPIARFEYDARMTAAMEQAMTINPVISGAGVEFGLIVLEFKSNWGGSSICINRVAVHMLES